MMTKTVAEWQTILDAADVPHGPVNNIGQAVSQPIIRERRFLKEVHHPTAGTVKVLGNPLRFAGCYEESPLEPPPLSGEHTRDVLGSLIGLSDAEIARLIDAKVIASADLIGALTYCRGKVVSKEERDGRSGTVKLQIEAVDQRGESTAGGWAVVVLPRRTL